MKKLHLLNALALTACLTLFGCKEGHDHDHDHAHDHGAHGETAKPAAAEATTATNAIAAAAAAGTATPYPLDTCLVGGAKLGSMGEPIAITHEGREIKFCCESCQPKFEKDPAKYLAKLDAAAK